MQNEPTIMMEVRQAYPEATDLVASVAAARVNGDLRGYGTVTQRESELDRLGLPSEGSARRLEIVKALQRWLGSRTGSLA